MERSERKRILPQGFSSVPGVEPGTIILTEEEIVLTELAAIEVEYMVWGLKGIRSLQDLSRANWRLN